MDIFFCDVCSTRVLEGDLKRGVGMRIEDTVVCGGCMESGKGGELLAAAKQAKPALVAAGAPANGNGMALLSTCPDTETLVKIGKEGFARTKAEAQQRQDPSRISSDDLRPQTVYGDLSGLATGLSALSPLEAGKKDDDEDVADTIPAQAAIAAVAPAKPVVKPDPAPVVVQEKTEPPLPVVAPTPSPKIISRDDGVDDLVDGATDQAESPQGHISTVEIPQPQVEVVAEPVPEKQVETRAAAQAVAARTAKPPTAPTKPPSGAQKVANGKSATSDSSSSSSRHVAKPATSRSSSSSRQVARPASARTSSASARASGHRGAKPGTHSERGQAKGSSSRSGTEAGKGGSSRSSSTDAREAQKRKNFKILVGSTVSLGLLLLGLFIYTQTRIKRPDGPIITKVNPGSDLEKEIKSLTEEAKAAWHTWKDKGDSAALKAVHPKLKPGGLKDELYRRFEEAATAAKWTDDEIGRRANQMGWNSLMGLARIINDEMVKIYMQEKR